MLLFKKKFLDAIRSGKKRQTIRVWKHRRMRSDQRSFIPGVGYIHILAVDPVKLESLTNEDARLDGFASAAEMLTEIRELYAEQVAAGLQAYRIRFEICSAELQERFREESKERKKNARKGKISQG